MSQAGAAGTAPVTPRTLGRLIAAQVCIHAAMTGLRMAAPLLALQRGHGAAQVGFLLALFALAQVFLALPAGRYADRHGLRRPVRLAVLAASSGSALALAWPVLPALCVAALLTGGATGVAGIALQRHVGRAAHGATQLRSVFSWLAIGPAVSNFIGPFCAGLLIDHAGAQPASLGGFRAAFALMALLPLVTWALVRAVHELPPVAAAVGGARQRSWDLLTDARFRRLLLVNWLLSSCWDVHTFVVPLLGHERGLPASVIGSILGAFAVAAAAVRVLIPLIAERLREADVVAGAMVSAALLFGAYPLLPGALAMGACSLLLGLALGSVQPMVMSLLHQITPEHRHGEALGLRAMAINASSVAMPLLLGSLGAVVGVGGLFWLLGAGVGLGSGLARRLRT
ncbi:MFS-type transporter involved in bile tolerance, Atg22 family [Oryzisolibacter propanilivorax]|uniref:MFS-type transporter involved in bile tolerance, Atg22 family n=1 Tax=Oryzisolibacter propanilivorax TaxID=1527607 RepID=A0A1G9P270_9BURK|nr:MFS transporter [Oryzisolibacter propanilivorax]SDL92730.1 MFS-type transporter involved in bile tolerance, Atg22 family [Oryzisolibacter propanilivorax]